MIILDKPNFPPYVCLTCGVGTGRKWFVDLALPLDNYFNPVNDGAVWYCNECWEGLTQAVAREAQIFVLGQEPWQGEAPTYESEQELVLTTVGINGPGISDSGTAGTNQSTTGNSEPATAAVTEPEPDSDDGNDGSLRDFKGFFGKS
jgi:hypothetical protein